MATIQLSALTSRGTVLSTEMNSLQVSGADSSNAFSVAGPEYDNSSERDRWGFLELQLGSITSVAGGAIYAYLNACLDGVADYDDGASGSNIDSHLLIAVMALKSGTGAKKLVTSVPFQIPPCLLKFQIRNGSGVQLASSGNTLVLYTANEVIL